MVDAVRLGDGFDECAARSAGVVVEDDAGGEAEEAVQDALPDSGNGAGAVAFECEEGVAGPVNAGAERVEVGVHRGPQVDGALDTADVGLSARHPSNTAQAVESII